MLLQTLKSLFTKPREASTETAQSRVLHLLREKQPQEAKEVLAPLLNGEAPEPETLALMGEVEFHLRQHEAAERLYMRALHLKPGLSIAHYGLSLIFYDSGRYFDALAQAQYACNLSPLVARYLAQLGLCQIATKGYGPARDTLRQAVLLDPENVPALNNYAIALHVLGSPADALRYIRRTLELNPDYEPAQKNLALILNAAAYSEHFDPETGIIEAHLDTASPQNKALLNEEDILNLEHAFSSSPDNPQNAASLIQAHIDALNMKDARDVLQIALAHHPENIDLLLLKAKLAQQLNQPLGARGIYERILAIEPDCVNALLGLGQTLRDLGKVNEALAPIERAATISNAPETLIQLAFAYSNACCYPECLAACDRVEALAPAMGPFLISSRAVSHAYLGNFEESRKWVEKAQQHEATSAGFQVFQGMLQLQHDNFADGWESYRHRALLDAKHQRLLPYPIWRGEDLTGKSVLILAEQGLGDQIMFASCLPDLLALKPGKILLEAHTRVERTLARSFPGISVIASGQKNFDWLPADRAPDYYLPIADLPYHFRRSQEAFPNHTGYLIADPDRVAYWRERLGTGRPTIGISWRGGLQRTRQAVRTLTLEQLTPLLAEPRARFVNLQYGDVSAEIAAYTSQYGHELRYFPEAIADLDEFAALISALDLVITVCNTTVHYAGALGKPCWVLTPHIPEWRYGLTSPRMHWYPSTRMFRQPTPGGWESVLTAANTALSAWLQAPSQKQA